MYSDRSWYRLSCLRLLVTVFSCFKHNRIAEGPPLSASPNTAAVSHRKPASAGTSCHSCGARGGHDGHAPYSKWHDAFVLECRWSCFHKTPCGSKFRQQLRSAKTKDAVHSRSAPNIRHASVDRRIDNCNTMLKCVCNVDWAGGSGVVRS
jgi:hypothetical protein